MKEADGAPDLIEWGDAEPARTTPAGEPAPAPVAVPAAAPVVVDEPDPNPVRRHPVALGLAVAGLIATLAAEYLPWQYIEVAASNDGGNESPAQSAELTIAHLRLVSGSSYGISASVLLALVALALAVRPKHSRAAGGVALGWAGGHLMIVIGVIKVIQSGVIGGGDTTNTTVGIGPGAYLALLATALLAMSALLVAWRPRFARGGGESGGPGRAGDFGSGGPDGGPTDLTVTAVNPRSLGDKPL